MKPHQERVVVEKRELDEKYHSLAAFIKSDLFKELPQDEQLRLLWQKKLMCEYPGVLAMRISYFYDNDDQDQEIDLDEIARTTAFVPHQEAS